MKVTEASLTMALKVKSKVWIENEIGMTVIGEGRFEILKAVRETGSLSKAARKLGQPFRRVWARVKDAEAQWGIRLVERSSKGSTLTADGEELLKRYAELHRVCNRYANAKFRKLFREVSDDSVGLRLQGD
jgi:molybdate transport system regulatory protein